MSDEPMPIAQLIDDLQRANASLKEATKKTNYARNDETTALNEVNRLQKLLDEAIEAVRNGANKTTDWGQRRLRSEYTP